MTGKIGRKKVLKFRDFPTRLHGEVFFVENGYDEKPILLRFLMTFSEPSNVTPRFLMT